MRASAESAQDLKNLIQQFTIDFIQAPIALLMYCKRAECGLCKELQIIFIYPLSISLQLIGGGTKDL